MNHRHKWVSYLRVSTAEQAERDLSLPAQQHAIESYAQQNGYTISHEYIENGCSGTTMHRKAFRQMLEDVWRHNSDIGGIIVHHTSRFTRNAAEARVLKEKLRKAGVRVLSTCQVTQDDPMGQLIEGIFECIDQYESEVNGMVHFFLNGFLFWVSTMGNLGASFFKRTLGPKTGTHFL